MRLHSLLALLILTTALTANAQQPSFTVAKIRPYDKAVPGQIMEVLVEGLTSGPGPVMLPATDFRVEVLQDGVAQTANVRIVKFSMVSETNSSNANTIDFNGMKMRSYQSVSFVVPSGLHPGPAEVVAIYRGQRGNAIGMEIVEKPLRPVVGTTAVLAVGGTTPPRPTKLEGNDLGWKLERGATTKVYVNPLVDPDDPNAAILVRFKQGNVDYDAVTRIKSTSPHVENVGRAVGFMAAREELEVDVPAALTLGKADVEIRVKANGQVSDPVNLTAMVTDVTRAAEAPNVSAPRLLFVTPNPVGAGQSLLISVDHRRTLEPEPKQVQVIIEQGENRYFATVEKTTLPFGPSAAPDAPVGIFVRTTRQLTGRVQIRVLNPLRGEAAGLSAPVPLEILDEVLPPQVIDVRESTDADLQQLKNMYAMQKEAGNEFGPYDPSRRYLTIHATGIDYNPRFVRITLEQAGRKFTLSARDFAVYQNEGVVVRMPKELTSGNVKFTIENSGGDRYSTPVTTSFVLQR